MRPFHYFKPVVCSVKVSVALTLRATKYEIQAGFRLVFLLTFSMEASGTLVNSGIKFEKITAPIERTENTHSEIVNLIFMHVCIFYVIYFGIFVGAGVMNHAISNCRLKCHSLDNYVNDLEKQISCTLVR
jgi:hypothetical protein